MADKEQLRKILEEIEGMRKRLEQLESAVRSELGDAPAAQPQSSGGQVADILDLAGEFRVVLSALLRLGSSTSAALAAEIGQDEATVRALLKTLVLQGYARRDAGPEGASVYSAVVTRRTSSRSGAEEVWKRLGV